VEGARPGGARKARPYVVPAAVIVAFIATALVVAAVGKQLLKSPPNLVRAGAVEDLKVQKVTYVKDARAFVVWDGASFLALSERDPFHGTQVRYCRTSGWFEETEFGSKFDAHGEYRLGPAPRGMSRFDVAVKHHDVFVDVGNTREGPARGVSDGSNPKGPFCVAVDKAVTGLYP
jgi:hypothetical protein